MLRTPLDGSRLLILTLAAACIGLSDADAQPPKAKAAVPAQAAQAKAFVDVKDVYGEDYAKAQKDPIARAALARALLQDGKETNDNLAARYVLFREARDLAAGSGDIPTAMLAIDEMVQDFAVPPADVLKARVTALSIASKAAAAAADAYQTVIDTALGILEESLNADDYDTAANLAATAEAAARKLKVVALVRTIQKRSNEVAKLREAFATLKPFADTLQKLPNDPKANLMIGRYQALTRGRWDRALPMLARGSDQSLRTLAESELKLLDASAADAAPRQLGLANAWRKQADSEQGLAKTQTLLHAYDWYLKAAAQSDPQIRAAAERSMKAITEAIPPEYRLGEITTEIRRLDGPGGPVFAVAFGPDSRKVVSGGADTAVRVWDARGGKELRRLDGNSRPVWAVAYSPDGRHAASGGFDRSIRLWDVFTGREARDFAGHEDYVRSVVFSRDGRLILSGGDDRLLRLWSVATGKEIRQFRGHDHFVWSVDLSRDGKKALSGSLDKTVRLWDVDTGSELLKLPGHTDTVLAVAFAPDGRRALSGSSDGTLKLWDLDRAALVRTFTGHKGYVQSVAFSPDGRRALSAGRDGTLRLWDVETGEEVRRLEGHTDQVWSVSFSPDGRWAVSAGNDGTVRLWGSSR